MGKAVIITFHCVPNYGAMLQAYAMQNNISQIVENAEILNYIPCHLMRQYKYFYFGSIRWFASCLLNFPFNFIKYHRFNKFMKTHMRLTKQKYATNEQIDLNCDYVFLGSDQIWSFGITDGVDKTYFGDFKKNNNCKVISYAPSVGKDKINDFELDIYSMLLKNIDCLSVREDSAKDFLGLVCDKEINVVLDPTLLVGKSDWVKVAKKCAYKNYLLIYSLNGYEETYNIAKKIAKEKGLKIYEIIAGGISFFNRYNHKILPFVGPSEFLGLINHADYIVTDSFHGTAFSVIFNKNFYTVPHKTKGSRMVGLLNKLGLQNRIICGFDSNMPIEDVDYEIANKLLEVEKEKSFGFIKSSVESR